MISLVARLFLLWSHILVEGRMPGSNFGGVRGWGGLSPLNIENPIANV